jgi:peptidoglycan/LPS O-acetylase OafA/YrhL
VAYLDGWRGLAILGVLFAHFFTSAGLNAGRLGVELFFVLSGRLMAEILFVRNMSVRKFIPRRFSRVYPALLIFVSTLLVASSWLGVLGISPLSAAASLTFTYNYYSIYIDRNPFLDHIWSLCIEEHMYFALAIISIIVRKTNGMRFLSCLAS